MLAILGLVKFLDYFGLFSVQNNPKKRRHLGLGQLLKQGDCDG